MIPCRVRTDGRLLYVRLRCRYSASPVGYDFKLIRDCTNPQNCIYTIYTDETLEYNQSIMDAISALRTSGVPRSEWPAEVSEKAGKERVNSAGEVGIEGSRKEVRKEVLKGLDPSLRAFLEYVSPSSVVPLLGVVRNSALPWG
jgi:hypothetical protein